MKSSIRGLFIFGACVGFVPTASWADREGVEYIADSGTLVYGGMRYARKSGNSDDAYTLHMRQQRDASARQLLRAEGSLSEIKASPRGDLAGVLERIWKEDVGKEDATYTSRQYQNGRPIEVYLQEESRLHVVTLNGAVAASLPGVRRYAWSPSGDQIGYITGTYNEDGIGFTSSGTWVYDIASDRSAPISSEGYDIAWAAWDGNIYIYNAGSDSNSVARVVRYEVNTGELQDTTHRGIYFSPDGRYYYDRGYEAAPARVFERATDRELPLDFTAPFQTGRLINVSGWYDSRTIVVSTGGPLEQGDYVYDIDSGQMWQANGRVLLSKPRGNDRLAVLVGVSSIVETEGRALARIR